VGREGLVQNLRAPDKSDLTARLKRIAGQVGGI
jgi:hypothetical protein